MPFNSDEYNDEDVDYIDLNQAISLIDLETDYNNLFDSVEEEEDYE